MLWNLAPRVAIAVAWAATLLCLALAAACSSSGDDDDAVALDDDASADDDVSPAGDDDDDNDDNNDDATPADPLFGPDADWTARDAGDAQGVQSVVWADDGLTLAAHLVGGDAVLAKGEISLDLRFVFGLDCAWPLDLSQSTIAFVLETPAGFPAAGATAQAYVQDANWKRQYGPAAELDGEGAFAVALQPTVGDSGGQTDEGFDPTTVRSVGLRVDFGDSGAFDGELRVTAFAVDPEIDIPAGPDLPTTTPPPAFADGDQWSVGADGFLLNGAGWFVVGGNWRMIEYGQNFGANVWFPTGDGVYKHQGFLRVYLDYLRRAGVKVVRVGLGEDGRNLFDEDGHVVGYDELFRRDVQTFLDLAQAAGVKVEFTLLDFLIAAQGQEVSGVYVCGRDEIFRDPTIRGEFVDDYLTPLVAEFGAHEALFGFDLINEPEWIVADADGGAWSSVDPTIRPTTPIAGADFDAYVAACLATIRAAAPDKPVTVGVSATVIPLIAAVGLDYAALHHYDWMGNLPPHLADLPAGLAWSLEEFATANTPLDVKAYLNLSKDNDGAGALPWNLTPGIDTATCPCNGRNALWTDLRAWVDAHPPI